MTRRLALLLRMAYLAGQAKAMLTPAEWEASESRQVAINLGLEPGDATRDWEVFE